VVVLKMSNTVLSFAALQTSHPVSGREGGTGIQCPVAGKAASPDIVIPDPC